LRPLLSKPGSDSRPFQVAAELHAERADWLASRDRSPEEELRSGLLRAEEALSRNPHNPEALFTKGRLHLQRARLAREPRARAEESLRAREAFEAALRENPQVAREHPHLLKEAEGLVR
jgi:eukaryotic-like serine/threonine-protein kinase